MLNNAGNKLYRIKLVCALAGLWVGLSSIPASGQNASTGAIFGALRDPAGAVIAGAIVKTMNLETAESRETATDQEGIYLVPLLQPGRYRLEVSSPGFNLQKLEGINVRVADRVEINCTLTIENRDEIVNVNSDGGILQTATTALGRAVGSLQVTDLPLVTRNFTQLTSLSTGVSSTVSDSLALGNGTQNVFTNGTPQLSTSFTIDGVEASNSYSGSAAGDYGTSGVATPSVDSIQEFKVQTALYDASFGRRAGANINVVTKSGTADFRGNVYEFLRNDALNANSFFFNSVGKPRPILRQNQFGGTLGGPVRRNRAYFFAAYEGMRQWNGAGLTSTSTLQLPSIPQERTAANLGPIFGGQTGSHGGLSIASDGSNINPVALRMLNAKLPDGQFLIPSPQRSGPGVNYAVSAPSPYNQDQFQINNDLNLAARHRLATRYFNSTSSRSEEFFQSTLPGFTSTIPAGHQNAAISDVYVFGSSATNEVRLGYVRFTGANTAAAPLKDSDVGIFRAKSGGFSGNAPDPDRKFHAGGTEYGDSHRK